MYSTSIKFICQASLTILLVALFSCFLSSFVFAQTIPANIQKLREQAAQEFANLIENAIEDAKIGALAELKTGEYKKLYESLVCLYL